MSESMIEADAMHLPMKEKPEQAETQEDVAEIYEKAGKPADIAGINEQTEKPANEAEINEQTEKPADVAEIHEQTKKPADGVEISKQVEKSADEAIAAEPQEQSFPAGVTLRFAEPVYKKLSRMCGAANRMDDDEIQEMLRDFGLNDRGARKVLLKRLKNFYRHRELAAANVIHPERGETECEYLLAVEFEPAKMSGVEVVVVEAAVVSAETAEVVAMFRENYRKMVSSQKSDVDTKSVTVNQFINHSLDLYTKRSTSHPVNQSANQPVNHTVNQSTNKSAGLSNSQPISHSRSTYRPIKFFVYQIINQPMYQAISYTFYQPTSHRTPAEFPAVMALLDRWMAARGLLDTPHTLCLVTDGSDDLSCYFHEQCEASKLLVPEWGKQWIDLSKCYSNFYHLQPCTLMEMLKMMGVGLLKSCGKPGPRYGLQGRLTNNMACAACQLLKDGCVLRVKDTLYGGLPELPPIHHSPIIRSDAASTRQTTTHPPSQSPSQSPSHTPNQPLGQPSNQLSSHPPSQPPTQPLYHPPCQQPSQPPSQPSTI